MVLLINVLPLFHVGVTTSNGIPLFHVGVTTTNGIDYLESGPKKRRIIDPPYVKMGRMEVRRNEGSLILLLPMSKWDGIGCQYGLILLPMGLGVNMGPMSKWDGIGCQYGLILLPMGLGVNTGLGDGIGCQYGIDPPPP